MREPCHNEDITRRIINRQEPPTQKWGPGLHALRDWTQPQTRLHAGPTRTPPQGGGVCSERPHPATDSFEQSPIPRRTPRRQERAASCEQTPPWPCIPSFFFFLPFFFLVAVYPLLVECDQAHLQPTSWKKPSTQPAVSTKSTRAAT